MSTDVVRVTIDEREVHVPKGTGLVETALAAGIEIPVFCYEPRLGEPVGACRMCLVEVEGTPKLQAGCTLTAQDGMVVKTARTSQQAAEGQNATLEFILVNHPLDCPVCDKGGECPLQDLTFRYGPGNTRMSFDKLTFEKPIPISPTISLDRERCILCYRCTRFSESVSEDLQLIAANRGAMSVITTFEDLPYRGAFTGNVTELCPVGALLPTQYRFEGRPWEIVDVPTVCGLCPVGCNIHATVREGKVKRILSRNHPEIDEGWICDKGRFAYTHLRAEDRLAQPLQRVRMRGLEPLAWEQAIDEAERLLRDARGRVVTVLSGSETVEQAYALGKLLRVGLGSHQAMLPEEVSGGLDAYRLPLSSIRDADVVVVLGDVPVVERAPVVDLWIKAAGRNGARILDDAADPAVAEAERVVLVWSGPGGRGGTTVAKLAEKLGLAGREGCGAFYLPETPNGRGVADAWAACCDEESEPAQSIGLLVVSGDEAAADENVRALAEQAEATIVISMFGGLTAGWADLVLPGTGYLEREGTFVNLEGRLQRLRRTVTPPCPDELEWIAELASRFDVDVAPYAAAVFAEVSERVYGGLAFGEVGELAPLRGYPEAPAHVARPALPEPRGKPRRSSQVRLVAYKPLFSGPAVERVAELQFQRPQPELELSADDARRRKVKTGDLVTLGANGSAITLPVRVNRRLREGIARVALEHANGLGGIVELAKAEEAVTP
jgi:NADH-quinone oxidoreductase subunit G